MVNMEPKDVLVQAGLNEKEAKVYVALLQLGQATALNIAKKARLKRPTGYVILEQLKEAGLVAISRSGSTTTFSALAPDKLYELYRAKGAALQQALPELNALYQLRPAGPKVEMFDGLESMKTLYYDAIEHLKEGEEVCFFGTFEHIEPHLRQEVADWKKAIRQYKKGRARELLSDIPLNRAYAVEMADLEDRYPIRFIPKSFGLSHMDFFVFGDKVATVSVGGEAVIALLITDRRVADSFRVLYEMAWAASGKTRKIDS